MTISGCGCSGDQYLILTNSTSQLDHNDDYCDLCSSLSYTFPGNSSDCSDFTIQEGCYSETSCNGTVTVSGSLIPTETPTPTPTGALSITCPAYSTSDTDYASQNNEICTFTACGGDIIKADACNCTGDTYLALFNGTDQLLYADDSNDCGLCSALTYTVPGSSSECFTYSLYEGCFEETACSAEVTVTGTTLDLSSDTPVTYPLLSSNTNMTCQPYSVDDTTSATQNYSTCGFSAAGGTSLTISGCGCSGDQYLQVYQDGSFLIGLDDSACGLCSFVEFIVPGYDYEYTQYTIHEGCYSSYNCSGTVIIMSNGNVYDTNETISDAPTESPVTLGTSYTCPFYSTSDTNYATQNYDICSFTACGGDTLTIDDCDCTGDQYLRLYYGGSLVSTDDDSSCNTCSQIVYTVPGSSDDCATLSVYEGCYFEYSCSGTVSVTGTTINVNTSTATVFPLIGNNNMSCVPYSVSNTASATQNYESCGFSACGGTTITVGECDCSGDQYLRLFEGTTQVEYDDDSSCNACSTFTFTVSGDSSECFNYVIHEGCFSSGSCSGTVTVSGSGASSSGSSTANPTPTPSATPTVAPTGGLTCPSYSASSTNSAATNYDTCSFTACGGSTVVADTCGCTGDTYLILYNGDTQVAYDDDSSCNSCSQITYTVPGSSSDCYTYSLHEGCFSGGSCSGTVVVTGVSVDTNTTTPTSYPLVGPSTSMSCAAYSASNTNSAFQNYESCGFSACGGTSFTISGCGCSGDQVLQLYQSSTQLSYSDDNCGACGYITYTVPGSSSQCYDYDIHEGCFSSGSCSGTVTVSGSQSAYTPSVYPSPYPVTTASPVSAFYCPSYSASNTDSASQNYDICNIYACGGDTITASACGCSGDTYLSLYSGSFQVAYSDDSSYCNSGTCSYLTYYVSGSSSSCSTFSLHEGCFSSGSCSASVYVTGASFVGSDDNPSNDDIDDDSKEYTNGMPSILVEGIIVPVVVVSGLILAAFAAYLRFSHLKKRSTDYTPSAHEVELAAA